MVLKNVEEAAANSKVQFQNQRASVSQFVSTIRSFDELSVTKNSNSLNAVVRSKCKGGMGVSLLLLRVFAMLERCTR